MKNGLFVSTEIDSIPSRVAVSTPTTGVPKSLEVPRPLIFEVSFISFQPPRFTGLSVYMTTESIHEVTQQQQKFNLRAPEGSSPTYRMGVVWDIKSDDSARVWEVTSGFDSNRMVGTASIGQEISYPGSARYVMQKEGDILAFSAHTDRGINTMRFANTPPSIEEFVKSFNFTVGIH